MSQQRYTYLVCAIGFWFAALVLFLVCNHAFGQASQPASRPAAAAAVSAKVWLLANLWWLLPLAINVLSSLATALTPYPKAGGVVKLIRLVIAMLGNVEFKDGKRPGLVLKAPFMPAALPPSPTPTEKVDP